MDRHGLILWENEATGSRKVFRYLLDLRDAINALIDSHHLEAVLAGNDVPGGWEHVPNVPCSEHVPNVPNMFRNVPEHV